VVKEESLNIKEVMEALDETQQVMRYSQQLEIKSRQLEQASQELKAANARLREMARLKDDFIATVTHELRTPITSIRSLTSIIHDHPDLEADKRSEFLGIIISESERISRLINQVLDLEKMESGQTDWEAVPVDLGEVVQRAVDGVRQLCEEKKARLELSLPTALPLVKGDADRLTQVMVNLLANAQKFCAETGGLVAVGVEEEPGKLRIWVRDNGPGIAPEAQPYIFDKFTQFTDHRSGRRQGSGLGLSITRRIVELHGGTIAVESVPGKGATFWVELPVI
jgi:signal transduction histidine kinase